MKTEDESKGTNWQLLAQNQAEEITRNAKTIDLLHDALKAFKHELNQTVENLKLAERLNQQLQEKQEKRDEKLLNEWSRDYWRYAEN